MPTRSIVRSIAYRAVRPLVCGMVDRVLDQQGGGGTIPPPLALYLSPVTGGAYASPTGAYYVRPEPV